MKDFIWGGRSRLAVKTKGTRTKNAFIADIALVVARMTPYTNQSTQ